METLYYESEEDRVGKVLLNNKLEEATPEDIEECKILHSMDECPHSVVKDVSSSLWLYRECAICGKGLGTVSSI